MIIMLEGIDGAGKTSVAKALQEKLGDGTVVMKFPSKWMAGVLDGTTGMSTVFSHMLDMSFEMYKTMRNAVKEGKHVIFDRFWVSTIVYQGISLFGAHPDVEAPEIYKAFGRGIHELMILAMSSALGGVPADDIYMGQFLLDLPVDEAKRRLADRGDGDDFDNADDEMFEARADLYRSIFRGDTVIGVLDKTPEQIAEEILEKCNAGHEEA